MSEGMVLIAVAGLFILSKLRTKHLAANLFVYNAIQCIFLVLGFYLTSWNTKQEWQQNIWKT